MSTPGKPSRMLGVLSTILSGIAGGILMACIMLFLLSRQGLSNGTISFLSIIAIAICLPACMDVLKRWNVAYGVSEIIMILLSLAICLLYAYQTSLTADTLQKTQDTVFIVHGLALLVNLVRLFYLSHREKPS